jgi:hypothetical protein
MIFFGIDSDLLGYSFAMGLVLAIAVIGSLVNGTMLQIFSEVI